MSKQVKERIKKIKDKALTEIPAIMQAVTSEADTEGMNKFRNARQELNLLVIKTVLGAKIEEGKKSGEWKLKYTKKLPSTSELNEICEIMDTYTNDHEVPFYAKFVCKPEAAAPTADGSAPDASMEIPKEEVYISKYKKLGTIDKISKKKLKEQLFQHNLASEFIDSSAVMVIASYGEKLRKKQNITTGLVVGGIALVVVGGVITGLAIAKHNKANDDIDGIDPDLDNMDVDVDADLPGEDAPMVDLA